MADVRLRDLNPAVLDYDLTVAGNVGIGTTSPVTTLNIKGGGSANGQLYIEPTADGDYAGLVIKTTRGADREWAVFAGGTGTDDLNFRIRDETSNTDRLNIDSSGNVGIGTTAPAGLLHLVQGSTTVPVLRLVDAGVANYDFVFPDTSTVKFVTNTSSTKDFIINNEGAGAMNLIVQDGKVGIGTASPGEKLHLVTAGNTRIRIDSGDSSASSVDLYDNGSLGARINCDSSKNLELMAGGRTGMDLIILASTGNVGIGTSGPSSPLHIESVENRLLDLSSTDATAYFQLRDSADSLYISSDNTKGSFGPNPGAHANNLNIDLTNGRVGIGTTSPTETLHVNGNLKVTGTVEVGASGFNVSTGFILAFGVAAPPSGWLACNGSAVSRTTYSDLYALIGTTYGAGDGSTTFNVPDLRGRTLIGTNGLAAGSFTANLGTLDNIGGIGGAQNHTLTTAELPSHTHTQRGQSGCGHDNCNGGWAASIYEHRASSRSRNTVDNIDSTGGGGSHNTVQPSLAISYLIKT